MDGAATWGRTRTPAPGQVCSGLPGHDQGHPRRRHRARRHRRRPVLGSGDPGPRILGNGHGRVFRAARGGPRPGLGSGGDHPPGAWRHREGHNHGRCRRRHHRSGRQRASPHPRWGAIPRCRTTSCCWQPWAVSPCSASPASSSGRSLPRSSSSSGRCSRSSMRSER